MRTKRESVIYTCVLGCHLYVASLILITMTEHAVADIFHQHTDVAPTPEFGSMPTNLTYEVGDTAILPCSVKNLGTKTVGWRKESEESPLTIGLVLFEQDPLISIEHYRDPIHSSNLEQWNLIIKDLQLHNNGRYECQISAVVPLKRYIQLNVKDKSTAGREAISLSGTEYVENNQKIKLSCNASGTIHAPDDIDWFKNGQKITPGHKNKIFITKYQSLSEKSMVSELIIDRASPTDAATYVCRSSNLDITSLRVHVLTANTSNVKRGDSGGIYSVQKQGSLHGKGFIPDGNSSGAHIELNISVLLCYLIIVVLYTL